MTILFKRTLPTALFLFFLVMVSCTTTAPSPVPTAKLPSRYLIDPRTGFEGAPSASTARKFDRAWQDFLAGDMVRAEKTFSEIHQAAPGYLPATLGLSAALLERGDPAAATTLIDEVLDHQPRYPAASVYRGEAFLAEGNLQRALDAYEPIEHLSDASEVVRNRAMEIRGRLFDQLYGDAVRESDPDAAIPLLRRALFVRPESPEARLALASKLMALGRFAEARKEVSTLSEDAPHRRAIEEVLAEIDAGQGAYQDAIVRLQTLAHDYPGQGYEARLDRMKQTWIEANMPPQYHRALETSSITRADLAVLLYWKITAIRFAQNLSQPPIAVDIGDLAGRDELIRALALRFLPVDPITHQADPQRIFTAAAFQKLITRILLTRSVSCATSAPTDSTDLARAGKVFEACHLPTPPEWPSSPEATVSGRSASEVLDMVEHLLTSSK
jgi:tetratricopeptide (TPR) repeat protein